MKRTLLAAALLVTVGAANATVSISGSPAYISFSNYNGAPLAQTGPQSTGLQDALLVSDNSFDRVTATFLGKEAAHIDQFWVNGSLVFNSLAAVPSSYGPFAMGSPLSFAFKDSNDGTNVNNGGNLLAFASYVVLGTKDRAGLFTPFHGLSNQYSYVLGFNDGSKIDADYDDLVVGFKVTAVPEPGTYALMLAGLGAIGFIARRRRAS